MSPWASDMYKHAHEIYFYGPSNCLIFVRLIILFYQDMV